MGELHSIAEAASASDDCIIDNKSWCIEKYVNAGDDSMEPVLRAIERQHPPKSTGLPKTSAENRIIEAETLAKVIVFRSRK